MSPTGKLVIILVVGALVAGGTYYYFVYRPAHSPKGEGAADPAVPPAAGTGNGLGSGGGVIAPPSVIGKTAYAKENGVKVLLASGSIYKTATYGEWLGTIEGQENRGGQPYYRLGGGRYVAVALATVR